jgi:hypothetical protein
MAGTILQLHSETEPQLSINDFWFCILHGTTLTHNHAISSVHGQKLYKWYHNNLLKINVNGESTIFGVASWIIKGQNNYSNLYSNNRPPLWAKMLSTISQPPPRCEHHWSINSLCVGLVSCTVTYYTALFLNQVISCQSSVYVSIFNFTNMHAMSHRSDFCHACSSKIDI